MVLFLRKLLDQFPGGVAHSQQLFCRVLKLPQEPDFLPGIRHGYPADKAALPRHGGNPTLYFQLPVGPLDGIGVDGQLHRQLPHTGELIPFLQNPGRNLVTDPVGDLGINGSNIPIIQVQHSVPPLKAYELY